MVQLTIVGVLWTLKVFHFNWNPKELSKGVRFCYSFVSSENGLILRVFFAIANFEHLRLFLTKLVNHNIFFSLLSITFKWSLFFLLVRDTFVLFIVSHYYRYFLKYVLWKTRHWTMLKDKKLRFIANSSWWYFLYYIIHIRVFFFLSS